MFFTRFQINPTRRGARKLLASPQAMHAAVLAGFAQPDGHTREGCRTLWRLDRSDHQILLYIVSPGEPDLAHLVEQAGWPTTETWQTRPYHGLLSSLDKGQRWAFRLTANPTHEGRPPGGTTDTKRFGAVTVEQQREWLTRRAENAGFTICHQTDGELNLVVHQRNTLAFTRIRGQRPVTLVTATYDGVLLVQDPERLRNTLTNGLGHAKAYGCGLLTLAHAATVQ